jgi:hypothetical protein
MMVLTMINKFIALFGMYNKSLLWEVLMLLMWTTKSEIKFVEMAALSGIVQTTVFLL